MSDHDEIIKACQDITINKLLDGERVKSQICDITDDLLIWGCRKGVCEMDVFWDLLEKLRKLSD